MCNINNLKKDTLMAKACMCNSRLLIFSSCSAVVCHVLTCVRQKGQRSSWGFFFPFFLFHFIALSTYSFAFLPHPLTHLFCSSTHPYPERLKPCCAMKRKNENASNQYAPNQYALSTNSAPPLPRPHRQIWKSFTL